MKRNILAIAIPALLVAAGAANAAEVYNKDGNKVDIYGRVYALNYINVGNDTSQGDGDKTSARLGFRGETQISEDLVGYGRFEWDRGAGKFESVNGKRVSEETRYAFAGFKFGEWGSFDYGRNDGVLKSVISYTDVLPEFGGDTGGTERFVTGRTNGVATYRNTDFFGLVDGLNFAIQYKDRDYNTDESRDREAYGASVEYLFDGFGVSAAYAAGSDRDSNHQEMSVVGAKYDANNLYVAATYSKSLHVQNSNFKSADGETTLSAGKAETWEMVAKYGIDFENGAKLTPSIAYLQGKDKTKGVKGSDKDLFKYFDVAATYDFNKNMSALVEYKINRIKDQDDTLALGLIYRF